MSAVQSAFDTPGRIKCGTVVTPAFDASLADYTGLLGLAVVERGTVDPALAALWGAPACAGRRTAMLAAPDGEPGFLRLIEGSPVAGYRPLGSFGWAAFELTVADCHALFAAIDAGPVGNRAFAVIGPPQLVPGFDNFIPFQVTGRGGETLYLNQVLDGAMSDLDLPHTTARVDHMFIAILAAPDREAAVRFHVEALGFEEGGTYHVPYSVINASFGLPESTITPITMTRTGRLPATEIDQYPAAAVPRPAAPGELPPGNALVSFIVASLDAVRAPFLAPPLRRDGPLYAGRRVACVRGLAGEAIELIEA